MTSVAAAVAATDPMTGVVQGQSPHALERVRENDVGLALWKRSPRASLHPPIQTMLTLPPFSELARGTPAAAVRTLMRRFPPTSLALGSDIEALAELFLRVTGESEVRLRLEHVADDACRCHHVDAVRLRMLCTYAGPGTEWLDSWSRTHWMAVMHIGIFKGTAFPDNGRAIG